MENEEEKVQQAENALGDDEGIYTKETVFLGAYSFDTIKESIENQFNNYIELSDDIDYVSIFYRQLEQSLSELRYDDEQHPEEKRDLLDAVYNEFIDFIATLIQRRLNITIRAYDEGDIYNLDLRDTIKQIYSFFILNARRVFKNVILMDSIKSVEDIGDDDETFFHIIETRMEDYDPLFTSMDVPTFLLYAKNDEMYELFETNVVSGNFLKKYSPKFYQNQDFKLDVINAIVLYQQFHDDVQRLADIQPEESE